MHWITFLCVARTKLDQEVKEREEKYSELDSKFNRLHKRAKQRIQEVQKVNFCYILFFFLFFYAVKVSLPPRKKKKLSSVATLVVCLNGIIPISYDQNFVIRVNCLSSNDEPWTPEFLYKHKISQEVLVQCFKKTTH